MNASQSPRLQPFDPGEVRRRAQDMLALATAGDLAHVDVDLSALGDALIGVLETTRETYPDLQIPPYGIWRRFEAGGVDRWGALAGARAFETAREMLAAAADLAILAVFMTTRTPDDWTFTDPMTQTRVQGRDASALAAFHMFAAGSFSSDMADPYRVDAETLIRLDIEELASGLQWDAAKDGELLQQMQRHLKRFGEALALRPDLFGEGEETRPGLLVTRLAGEGGEAVDAAGLADRLLEAFAPLWEGGAAQGDISFGDSFAYAALNGNDGETIVPFHLHAQEMVYSLVEPVAWAGLEVAGLEGLTGPADDAHAALFLQYGAMKLRDAARDLPGPEALGRMVELRAVAVALTDLLAESLRKELDVTAEQLPLTCILEGGSSRAGAQILRGNSEKVQNPGQFLNPGSVFWLPFGA